MSDKHIRDVYEMTKYYDIVGTITKLYIKTYKEAKSIALTH